MVQIIHVNNFAHSGHKIIFISHMVQIIPNSEEYREAREELTLYPTWFR